MLLVAHTHTPPQHTQQSFGEPKPCLCGAPACRKILSGKPLREEAPKPQLTAKGQQTQREAAAAEAFRRRLVGKPLGDISDLVLFFNGRTSKGEMAQVGRGLCMSYVCNWILDSRFGGRPCFSLTPPPSAHTRN